MEFNNNKKISSFIIISFLIIIFLIAFFYFFKSIFQKEIVCGDTIKYAGEKYETIEINKQCWLKRNLNVGSKINNDLKQVGKNRKVEKYCYEDNLSNCDKYGGLYIYDEAMNGSEIEGIKGICPNGFHIPTDEDFYNLENYLKGSNGTCNPNRIERKDCGFADAKLKNGGSSKFDALFSGYHNGKMFLDMGYRALFLTSTKGIYRAIDKNSAGVFRSVNDNLYGLSIRCIKD